METILQPVYYRTKVCFAQLWCVVFCKKKLPNKSGSFKILVDSYDLITGIGNGLC